MSTEQQRRLDIYACMHTLEGEQRSVSRARRGLVSLERSAGRNATASRGSPPLHQNDADPRCSSPRALCFALCESFVIMLSPSLARCVVVRMLPLFVAVGVHVVRFLSLIWSCVTEKGVATHTDTHMCARTQSGLRWPSLGPNKVRHHVYLNTSFRVLQL